MHLTIDDFEVGELVVVRSDIAEVHGVAPRIWGSNLVKIGAKYKIIKKQFNMLYFRTTEDMIDGGYLPAGFDKISNKVAKMHKLLRLK
jgi:hypothetical protein